VHTAVHAGQFDDYSTCTTRAPQVWKPEQIEKMKSRSFVHCVEHKHTACVWLCKLYYCLHCPCKVPAIPSQLQLHGTTSSAHVTDRFQTFYHEVLTLMLMLLQDPLDGSLSSLATRCQLEAAPDLSQTHRTLCSSSRSLRESRSAPLLTTAPSQARCQIRSPACACHSGVHQPVQQLYTAAFSSCHGCTAGASEKTDMKCMFSVI
jgi:hypothetical protein